jgi:PAS domain S-box-containing protein
MNTDINPIASALLGTAADGIIATDRDGTITFWNPGAERIFGYSAQESLGQSLDLIIPPRFRPRHWAGFRQVMETGESRYSADQILAVPSHRKDGDAISIEFTIALLRGANQVVGVVAIVRDVTARFQEVKALRDSLRDRKAQPE